MSDISDIGVNMNSKQYNGIHDVIMTSSHD